MQTLDLENMETGDLSTLRDKIGKIINDRYRVQADLAEARIGGVLLGKKELAFNDSELRYAAFLRCECGAGMAYPKDSPARGSWHCSEILKLTALPANHPDSKTHTGAMPFAFWEVKSEDQASAGGATTRPKGDQNDLNSN